MNILLVDDNVYTIRALKNGIDYTALGFSEVYTARSMKDAVDCMEKGTVELVLTDIEMPNGTGLQLLEWINLNRPDTVTLFCTSFANFDYAKKAVELHSFDYYLKPIQYEDLQKILEKAVEEVKRRAKARERERYETYWKDSLSSQKMDFWKDVFFWVDGYDAEELRMLAESRHLAYVAEDRFTLGMLKFNKEKSRMSETSGGLEHFIMKNIVEELCGDVEMEIEMLQKCGKDTWALVLTHAEDLTGAGFHSKSRYFLESISQALECTALFCYAYQAGFLEMRDQYLRLESFCADYIPAENRILAMDRFRKDWPQEQEDVDLWGMAQAVKKAKHYIDEHFQEAITRESLSEALHFSAGHLAKSFKKEMGISLGAYIIEKRMEQAKYLLRKGGIPVMEVALLVGYDNFSYFSRLFKLKNGISPKEYQKEMSE